VFSSLLRFAVVPLLGMNLWQLIFYKIILLPIIQFHHSNVNAYDAQEWQTTWGMLKTPFLTTSLITK